MTLIKKLLSCEKGTSLILFAAIITLMIAVIGIVVDVGRLYAVHNKVQNASDAALLGAVATRSTTDVQAEMVSLFHANYPHEYMGSEIGEIVVTEVDSGIYEATFKVGVPTVIMKIFGKNSVTVQILSQVSIGYEVTENQRLELALVLDNTGSMAGQKIEDLKQASRDLTNILFGDAETLENLHISILPYNLAVNVGSGHSDWVQPDYLDRYLAHEPEGNGFLANRNSDGPPNDFVDFSDAAPTSESAQLRTPSRAWDQYTSCPDFENESLPRMRFAMNIKSEVLSMIDTMIAGNCTRINVGLMWGWFTLSPQWRGIWDSNKPDLPADPHELLDKAVVLMTDGNNTVYLGSNGANDDDVTTALMCEAVKAQGIKLYTVGFGGEGDVNVPLLEACATAPNYFFLAPTADDLRTAFQQIADDIVFSTIRLSQ